MTPEQALEAEARSIAALPHLSQRRAWLEYIERTHGKEKADKLRALIGQLWDKANSDEKN